MLAWLLILAVALSGFLKWGSLAHNALGAFILLLSFSFLCGLLTGQIPLSTGRQLWNRRRFILDRRKKPASFCFALLFQLLLICLLVLLFLHGEVRGG